MDRKSIPNIGKENKPLVIPPTPDLKRLGYGTGVGIFNIDRSPKDGKFNSPWALKKLIRGTRCNANLMGQRLRNEANILKSLNHPNIVGFRAFLSTPDGRECLAMEKCHTSLGDLIEEREGEGPFPSNIILKVAVEVAKGLDYIHNVVHLLHGDIKSPNVLIKGNFDSVKLCDFGVSLPLTDKGTFNKAVAGEKFSYVGTKLWSAPEVCEEKTEELIITDKADIFAYGLTLWEMMALSTPHTPDILEDNDESFDEDAYEEKINQLVGTKPDIPEHLKSDESYEKVISLFMKCTEENYEERFSAKAILKFCDEELNLN